MKNEELEIKLENAVDTIGMVKLELDDLKMALDKITTNYGRCFDLNFDDLKKYLDGDTKNIKGEKTFYFVIGNEDIMWLVRTARTYCEQAQKLCESFEV